MENLGALALVLAFCLSAYAVVASAVGGWRGKAYLVVSAGRAVLAVWFLVTLASSVLVAALVSGDFRLAYVAANTNRAMPALYKFAAWWGGQEGSLLFWSWVLASYALVVVLAHRRHHRALMPYVTAVLMATQCFFLILNAFVASPFRLLAVGRSVTAAPDGNGLNPLLQYWAMAAHPPALYLGYVGFTVPYAFAMASLVTRTPGEGWIRATRRWALVTWLFQSIGIMLGAGWAYAVLGWGGYWGWDPVENASLLPWLTATAFLHSVMMQERKGMMKVWNVALVSATFLLSILGTFLTRSGVVSSVHAFAQSAIGVWFAGFLLIALVATALLMASRLDQLRSEARLESVVSRESSFLFNNLLFVAACFAVLWGTLFPLLSELVTGEKISVDAPFFNRVNVPLGLLLLFLTGVAPLLPWRRSSLESLKRNLLKPALAGLALMLVLAVAGVRHPYALIAFGLALFVAWAIVTEFYRGARAIRAHTGMNPLAAAVELTLRNTRRYGGYLVHMGVVLMFVGFAGSAFNRHQSHELAVGEKAAIGRYELRLASLRDGENENFAWDRAGIEVFQGGKLIARLEPERRFYKASRQATSEVAIRRGLREDLYLNFAGM
ncbi:MAG: heme lyase CcmF/NrfE family subunit, partial [Bryobacteraceae bacterium]